MLKEIEVLRFKFLKLTSKEADRMTSENKSTDLKFLTIKSLDNFGSS